jgi:hypothetical protein
VVAVGIGSRYLFENLELNLQKQAAFVRCDCSKTMEIDAEKRAYGIVYQNAGHLSRKIKRLGNLRDMFRIGLGLCLSLREKEKN